MPADNAVITLLNAVTTTGAGSGFLGQILLMDRKTAPRSYQCQVVGTGTVTATVNVEVSIDGTYWETMCTFTLSGTTSDSDGYVSNSSWPYTRGNVTAISGTGAAVTLKMAGA